jgi:hypothetical protein
MPADQVAIVNPPVMRSCPSNRHLTMPDHRGYNGPSASFPPQLSYIDVNRKSASRPKTVATTTYTSVSLAPVTRRCVHCRGIAFTQDINRTLWFCDSCFAVQAEMTANLNTVNIDPSGGNFQHVEMSAQTFENRWNTYHSWSESKVKVCDNACTSKGRLMFGAFRIVS